MVETRSGKMQDPAQERIMAEESAKPQPGVTIGRDASSDPVVLNPNIDIPKYDGMEDPRPWIESLEEIGFLYHWADYIISRYAAMNMTGSAKTWLNLHKASFTSWENIKIRLIQDFSLDANKEELRMKLNRMQHWNEPAIRFAEDILVLCNKVDPAMEEETKIEHVIGGLKKEYSFALYLNPPKTTDDLLVVCKKMDYFEKKYRERVEKSRNLYNGPRYSRPQQQSRYVPPTAARNYQTTSRPQAPVSNNYKNDSPPTPRQYRNNFPQPSTPRRPYNPNFVPKPNLQRNTYNKSQEVSKNRTEDGRPICFKCNKPGHVARYCRVKFIRILEEDPADTQEKVEDCTITHCTIDCKQETIKYDLTNNHDEINFEMLKIKSAKDSIVPECSIKLIKALVETEDGEYIIEESSKMFQTNGLRLARSLINVIHRETQIWITNPYPRPLKIMKNQTLAFGSSPAKINVSREREVEENEEPRFQINENLSPKEQKELKQVLERYGDLFSSRLGRTNLAKHRIDTEDAKPIKHKPYRVSAKERDIIKEQIDEMLTEGIIRPSSSPWSFPVILVKKRDGKYRFCVDYRKLNNVTVKDVYPIPRIDEVMDTLQGSTHFSAIDLRSGYWQVEVEERDKEKTAFTTAHGLYEFNVMPFGLCNAPATFERNMENMLGNLRWQICLCYLDDVIIYSPDFPTHLKRLEAVFRCFRESNLRLNDKKCRFAFEELEILGYITSKHGIKPAEHNIKAVRNFPRPKKVKEVQSFLGMCSYYRKFIKDFSKIADPLTNLIKKCVSFTWTERQEEAFQTLKTALLSPPILGHLNPNAPTYVHTDASNIGIGATLVQDIGGEEKVISYLSRTLSKAEQNYSTTEKECLAVVWSMSKLRPYLYGRHFKIVTDHHAFCWLKNLKDPTGRLARWALKIQEYDFDIIHKSGKKHLDADGLFRGPLPETDWDEDFERLFLNQITDEEDKFIESVKKNLNGSRRSIAQNFKVEDGCLFKKNPNPEGRAWLLVVPEKKKREIMKEYHNHMSNGHLGVARTMYRIKSKYFWPSMLKDVSEFVKTCHLCQSRKGSNQLPSGLLQPIPPANFPFERIGIDFVGPLPSTKNRKKWIIVLTDYYTRYAETKAISKATVKEVSKFLVEDIFLRHGAPQYLISDRGSQFTSNLMKEVMKTCKIKHCFTTSYHPQTNGLTERLNRTLINMLSMYVNTDQKNWDEILPFITHAYNTTIQETTGYSPFFLMFGREPTSLLDDRNISVDIDKDDYDEYIKHHLDKINRTRKLVINNTIKTQERMKKNYDKKHVERSYEPGELVAVWTPIRKIGKCEKLLRKYFGPYKILKKLSNVNYLIEPKDNPGQDPLIVHVSRIKPYFERIDEVNHEDVTTSGEGEVNKLLVLFDRDEYTAEHHEADQKANVHEVLGEVDVDDARVGHDEPNCPYQEIPMPAAVEGRVRHSQLPDILAGVVLAESPGCAEKVPERPSMLLPAGEELSPKDINMKKIMEISSENQKNANSPAGDMHVNPAAARGDVTAPKTAATTSATTASPASLNWADSEMAEMDANDGYTVVKSKKRRLVSPSPDHASKQPSRPAEKRSSQQQKRPTGPRSMPPQEIKTTRANIADAKARQTTTNHENYVFVELCPDIPDYSYFRAIGHLLGGPGKISQFNRMNGHYVVGLASKDHASRLVEVGLDIEGTHLKVFPFRKRAERITIANLPGFVEDSAIVEPLRNFGTVTSIAPIMIRMGEYTFNDGRREAFILLREGVRLESMPTRLTIKSKGDTLSAFLSFGIKCSKCGKQGHRRANCPALARQGNGSPRQAASPTDARPRPPPPPPQQPRKPAPSPATPASPVQPAKTLTEAPAIPSAPHPAEPKDLAQPAPVALPAPMAAPRPLEPTILSLDIEMSEEERTSTPSTPTKGKPTIVQLREHLEKLPSIAIDHSGLLGLDWEDAQKLLASPTNMKKRLPSLLEAQVAAFTELAKTIMASCPNSNTLVYKTLQKTRTVLIETNAYHLGSGQDLCLGYNAVVLAHPVAISGSGLACVFGPGVAVLQQRVLWPGHIALATIDVHGEEMTAIAVHLAHEPRERNRQLELLAAQEEEGACWIIGDFNIRDRGPSSSSSSDALAALLDLAALVDVATQFDAAHLPTRVARHGDQVESSRLDRILVPAGVLDRVSIYATSHYHLSDHRLVLLQVGPPTTAVSSPTQPRLAAMLRSGLVLEHLAGYIRKLEEDTTHDDDDGTFWDRWTTIKAGLLAEARSLHDPRHAASDSYVYRARPYIAAQLEASSIRADYPSLPDLARAIRLRRPVSVIRDKQDNIIEGPELRRRAFATFQPRFARPTSDPAAGAAFIASSAPTTTRELSEEDPLHRPDISPSEIANAIEHLPRGKAPGWDGLPCELLVAFNEDFFAEALVRVFAASRLRGALPPSTRRRSICLVPKARGGRGLDGYRPVALPSADYRVLAAILHRRLKPHLRALVPDCQTYAVPERSSSWNIAKVTDAVEEATAMGSPLAVMGIDLESTFDSLDRGFLESLMTPLRLPPAFMGWISILYAGADATIRAGGFHTTAFPLLNGLRQGCAVSAALFSIATGPLLRRLELTLGVGNVIAYADDIVLLFHRDEEFERVATVLEDFKRASGIAVNLGKSAGLWCGAWRNRGDSPLGASWSTTSIRVLRLDIAPRSSVAYQEQHLLALLESACRRWTPFTRGLSLVGRARAANSLVGSTIQHHLHGYLPSPPTIAKLQARLARFVWGPEHTAWLPAAFMARPVAIGGLGLLDLATQLQLACLKGLQVALRGGRNGFDWLVASSSEAWIRPPPDGTRLQPRRLRLLKLWEEASKILSLNHHAVPTSQLLDLPIIGGCRFLRPPDLLAPARWLGVRVRDFLAEDRHIARPTRSALADAATLGAFCRRLTSENAVGFGAESTPSSSSLAAAVVLRGTATPFLNGLTTRSARRALDRPRLAATPISRFLARLTPTFNPPSRIDWASNLMLVIDYNKEQVLLVSVSPPVVIIATVFVTGLLQLLLLF
ncbi:hypothetical protein LAZ67_2005815, partial [Cordylochernes scorpioides]